MKHQARILAAIEHNLSNGLIESTNTKWTFAHFVTLV